MTKTELLRLLAQEWGLLLAAMGRTPLGMMQSAVSGDWTPKDIAGHITTWETDSLRAALEWAQGRDHTPLDADPSWSLDAWNAEQVAAKHDEPVALVFAEFGTTHTRLVSLLTMLPEPVLTQGERMEKLTGDTWHHYREHRLALEAWLAQR
jgi:hypothetical protein